MLSKTGRWPAFYKMNPRHRYNLTFWFEHNVARSGVNRNWKICRRARRWQLACLGHSSAIDYFWFLDRMDRTVSPFTKFVWQKYFTVNGQQFRYTTDNINIMTTHSFQFLMNYSQQMDLVGGIVVGHFMSELCCQYVSERSVSFILKNNIIEEKLFRAAKIRSYTKILLFVHEILGEAYNC